MKVLGLVLALQGAPAPSGELPVKSTDPPYQLVLPRGYARADDKEIPVSFERPLGSAAWERVRVGVVPLKRLLDQDPRADLKELLAKVPLGELREWKPVALRWEDFELQGLEGRTAREGIDMVVRCAFVPLSPQAIAVVVAAPSTHAREVPPELLGVLGSVKGRTTWLTPREKSLLRYYLWPGYAAPAVSALFLAAWTLFFRGRPTLAHGLRIAWHLAVVAIVGGAYFLLQQSSKAREKLDLEAPHLFWVLVLVPLFLFHALMAFRRVKVGVEMGD